MSQTSGSISVVESGLEGAEAVLHSTTGRLLDKATIGATNAGHRSPPKENMPVSGIRVLAVHSLGGDALLVDRLPHRQLADLMVSVLGSAKSRSTESQAMLLQQLHLIVANDGEIRHMLRHVGPSARHPREHVDPIQEMLKSSQRLISDKPANKYSFASPSVLRQLARQLLGAAGEQHSLLDRLARAAWAQQSKPTGAGATSQSDSIDSDGVKPQGNAREPALVSVPVETEQQPSAAAAQATPPSDTKRPSSAEQNLEQTRGQSAESDGPLASSAYGSSDVATTRHAPPSRSPVGTASAVSTEASQRGMQASLGPATGPVARQPDGQTASTDLDGVVGKAKGAAVNHTRGKIGAGVSIGAPSVSAMDVQPASLAVCHPVRPPLAPDSPRRASIDLDSASGFESDDSAASSIYAQPADAWKSGEYNGLFAATGQHPTRTGSSQRTRKGSVPGDQSRLVRRAQLAYHSMQHAAVLRGSLDSRHMASTSNAAGAMRQLDAWLNDHPSGRFASVGVDLDLQFAGSSPVVEAMPSSGSYGLPALALPSSASVESTVDEPAGTCEDECSIVPREQDGIPRRSAVHSIGKEGADHSGGSGADTPGHVSAFLHRACTDASKSYFVVRRPGSQIVRVFSLQRSHDGISDPDSLKSDRKTAKQQYADDTNQASHPRGVTLSLVGLLDLDSSHEWILQRAESAVETPQSSPDRSAELRRQLDSVPAESLSAMPLGAIFELFRASGAHAVSIEKEGAFRASYSDSPVEIREAPLPALPGMHHSPSATSKQAPPLFRDRLATLCVRNARKLLGAAAADQQMLREGRAAELGRDTGGASGRGVCWSDSFHTSCDSVDLAVRMLRRASEILAPEIDSAGISFSDRESHGQASGSSSFGSMVRAASRSEPYRDGSAMQGWLSTVAETCSAIEFGHAMKLAATARESQLGEGALGATSGGSDCWQHCHTHGSEFEIEDDAPVTGKGCSHDLRLVHEHLEQSLCSQLLFTMKTLQVQLDGICQVLSAASSSGGSATTQEKQDQGLIRFQVDVICDIVVKAIRCTTGSVRALGVSGCRSTKHNMANLIESLISALAAVCAAVDQHDTPQVRSAIAELVCVVDASPGQTYPRKIGADLGSVGIGSELLECAKQIQEAVERAVGTAQLEGAVHSIPSALVHVGAMCYARIMGTGTRPEASVGHGDASELTDEHVRMLQLASCIISPLQVPCGSGIMSIPIVPSGHILDGGQRKLSDVVLLPTLRPLTTSMSTQRVLVEEGHESGALVCMLPSTRAALQHRLPALYQRMCDSRQVPLSQIQGWALLHQSMPLHVSIASGKEDRAGSASGGSPGAASSKSRRSRRARAKGGGGPSSRTSAARCSKAQKVGQKQWVLAHAAPSCVILSLLTEQILQRWVVPPSRSAASALSPFSYDFAKHCIDDASRSLLLYGQPAGTIQIYACLLSLTEPDAKVAGLAAFLEALPGPMQPNRPRLLLKPRDLLEDDALLLSRLALLGGSCVNACLSLASSGVQPRQNRVMPVRLLTLCLGAVRASQARGARAPSVASKGSLQYVVSPGSRRVECAVQKAFRCACWTHGSSPASSHAHKLSSLSVPAESLLCICSRVILQAVYKAPWSADTYRRVCKPLLRDMRNHQSQLGSPGLTAAGDTYLPSQVQLSYAPLASIAHRIATPPDEKHPFLAAMHLLCAAEGGRRTSRVPTMGRLVAAELAQIQLQISAANDLFGAASQEKSFADERVSMFATSAEAASEGIISDRRRRARQAAVEVCQAALDPLLSAQSLLELNPNQMFALLRSLAEEDGTSIPDQTCVAGAAATADGSATVPVCESESTMVWTPAEVYPLVAKKLPVSLLYQRPFDEPDLATTAAAGVDGGTAKRADAGTSSSGCQEAMMVWMRGMVAMKKRLAGKLTPGGDGVIAAASAGIGSSSACQVAMQSREQMLLLDLLLRSAVLSSANSPAEGRSHSVELGSRGVVDLIASTSLCTRIMEIGRVDSYQAPATMLALLPIIQRFGLVGKLGSAMEVSVADALLGGCWARGMPNLIMQRLELLVQSGSIVCSQEQAEELMDIVEVYTSRIQFMEKGTLGLQRLLKATSASARSLIAALRALG